MPWPARPPYSPYTCRPADPSDPPGRRPGAAGSVRTDYLTLEAARAKVEGNNARVRPASSLGA